jgi:hypothetical protein
MRPLERTATIGLLLSGCNAFVGDYAADLVEDPTVDATDLCTVERTAFVYPLDLQSDEALADTTAYYDEANPELVSHLTAVAASFRHGESGAGITYVLGAAGVGKSFAARNVIKGFSDTEKCTVKVSDLFREDKDLLSFAVQDAPDLATTDGQLVFNTLPAFADVADFDFKGLLRAAGCEIGGQLLPVIVIDDLDEAHDMVCQSILEDLDEFVLGGAQGAGPFVHVIVFGRPEGFYTWLADPARTEQSNQIVRKFVLQAPRYDTAGDLAFRVTGYLDFSGQLDAVQAAGDLDNYIASTTSAAATHGFLTYSLSNLALGNFVVQHTAPGLDQSEPTLKAGLFDDLMVRASETHGRPLPGGPLASEYLRLLEDIAVQHADVDGSGEFSVLSEDTVDVVDESGSSRGKVRVRDVLNRSGLALLTSASATASRYRFYPFWVHGHLIQRYNQRVMAGYTYRPCDTQ